MSWISRNYITYVLAEIYNPGFTRDWPITLVCHAPHGAAEWLPMVLRHAKYLFTRAGVVHLRMPLNSFRLKKKTNFESFK